MSSGAGYLLPEGDASEDELACALVFYPNRDEYRRALMGSLYYLGTWTAWERDTLKRGKDAAASWKLATEQTEACMAICDDIITLLGSLPRIEALLQQLGAAQCCDVTLTSETATTDLTAGGPPPATWGDGIVVTDQEHWQSLMCKAAHDYVDLLISDAEWLAGMTGAVVIGVGLVAALLGIASGAGIILAIGYGTLSTVAAGLLASILAGDHVGVPANLEAARADIVCAIVHGGPSQLSDAIEEAVGPAAWLALYQWIDYESAWATMAEGGNQNGTLPGGTRTDCDCNQIDLGDFVLHSVSEGAGAGVVATRLSDYSVQFTRASNNNALGCSISVLFHIPDCPSIEQTHWVATGRVTGTYTATGGSTRSAALSGYVSYDTPPCDVFTANTGPMGTRTPTQVVTQAGSGSWDIEFITEFDTRTGLASHDNRVRLTLNFDAICVSADFIISIETISVTAT